jgi:potassium channel subfamily K
MFVCMTTAVCILKLTQTGKQESDMMPRLSTIQLLLLCLPFWFGHALIPLPVVLNRMNDPRPTARNFQVRPTHQFHNYVHNRNSPLSVRVDKDDDDHISYRLIRKFLTSLSKGIFFALPMRPSLTQALFGIKGKRKNEKKNPAAPAASVSFTLRECFLSIFIYLLVGICFYHVLMEHWSLIDSVYFSITTFTTVGYGDLAPHTPIGKIFTCFFSLGGIAFLGAALASIGANLVQAEVNAVNAAKRAGRTRVMKVFDRIPGILRKNNTTHLSEISNITAVVPFNATLTRTGDAVPLAQRTVLASVRSVLWKLIPSFALLLTGGVVMGKLEGWGWVDSIYYAIITAGTVGLGDLSPQRQRTRFAAILFIPFAVSAGGEILGTVASAFLEHRRIQVYNEFATKDLTMEHLSEMDRNGDGEVSRLEYMQFMLVEMKIVEQNVLDELNQQFDRLDMTMSDSLTKDDLIAMAKLRRSQEEALLAANATVVS